MKFTPRDCALSLITVLILAGNVFGQAVPDMSHLWSGPSRQLVQNILSRSGKPSSIFLVWQNKSSLSLAELAQIHKAVETEFHSAEVRLLSVDRAPVGVRITLSEESHGLLWVAEIKQGTTTQVSMLAVPRPATSASALLPTIVLNATRLWSQAEPMLDFSQPDAKTLLVLDTKQLSIFNVSVDLGMEAGKAKLQASLPIVHSQPWPRDARGRLLISGDHVESYLPGVKCTGTLGQTPSLNCMNADDPWPLDSSIKGFYSPSRNFFTGVLVTGSGDRNVPSFFSFAQAAGAGGESWIFAGTDGLARVYGNLTQTSLTLPLKSLSGWGSDIALVKSNCGSKAQVLVTRPDNFLKKDSLRAIEIVNGEELTLSNALEFDGAFSALWTSADGSSASAIYRNASTGLYEAVKITLTCSQ